LEQMLLQHLLLQDPVPVADHLLPHLDVTLLTLCVLQHLEWISRRFTSDKGVQQLGVAIAESTGLYILIVDQD
jgi:hypothetical protein